MAGMPAALFIRGHHKKEGALTALLAPDSAAYFISLGQDDRREAGSLLCAMGFLKGEHSEREYREDRDV
jgi:hypothetical protein